MNELLRGCGCARRAELSLSAERVRFQLLMIKGAICVDVYTPANGLRIDFDIYDLWIYLGTHIHIHLTYIASA